MLVAPNWRKRMNIKKIAGILCLTGVILLSGCNADTKTDTAANQQSTQSDATRELFAMDTYMMVTAYGENAESAADAAIAEIERLDALLSTGSEESEVGRINENGSGELSEDTSYLLERSMEIYEATEGAFDITIYPIMEAWGFTTQNYQVPEADALETLLSLIDTSEIKFDKSSREVSFGLEGMQIDFGGIAKGYTSSRIVEIWQEYGITSGLINLGGNVQALGSKTDGSNWRIAIQNPNDQNGYIGIIEIQDKAVITSGGYERYFEQDGVLYHHIIDPSTGYPAETGLISVTIVSGDGTLADGLSTSLFVMGKDKAVEFWQAHSEEFDAILMTEDNVLYVTEGIAENFTTELPMEIISK